MLNRFLEIRYDLIVISIFPLSVLLWPDIGAIYDLNFCATYNPTCICSYHTQFQIVINWHAT